MSSNTPIIISAKIYNGEHLPKADVMGTIDPYVKVRHGERWAATGFKPQTQLPRWHDTLIVRTRADLGRLEAEAVRFEVWDHDALSSDDLAATATRTLAELHPGRHREMLDLALAEGVKAAPGGPPTLYASAGWVLDYPALKQRLSGTQGAFFDDAKRTVVVPAPQLASGAHLLIEYEKDEFDFKILLTQPAGGTFFDLFFKNRLARKVHQRDAKGGWRVGPLHVYSEIKLDDVRFHSDFSALQIQRSKAERVGRMSLAEIVSRFGWDWRKDGSFSYREARQRMRGIIYDDSDTALYMPLDDCYYCCDFDSGNVDDIVYLRPEAEQRGRMIDLFYDNPSVQKVRETFRRPKRVGKDSASGRVELDDVPYSVSMQNIFLDTYQLSEQQTWSILDLMPLYG